MSVRVGTRVRIKGSAEEGIISRVYERDDGVTLYDVESVSAAEWSGKPLPPDRDILPGDWLRVTEAAFDVLL